MAIVCLVGSAFMFIRQTKIPSWGANIRMSIATVLVFWTFVEILGHNGLINEIWVRPLEHVAEITLLALLFIALGVFVLYKSLANRQVSV